MNKIAFPHEAHSDIRLLDASYTSTDVDLVDQKLFN